MLQNHSSLKDRLFFKFLTSPPQILKLCMTIVLFLFFRFHVNGAHYRYLLSEYISCQKSINKHLPSGWRRKWQPTPVFLPGEFLGQRSLVGYSPWGGKELDTTKRLNHHHHQAVG